MINRHVVISYPVFCCCVTFFTVIAMFQLHINIQSLQWTQSHEKFKEAKMGQWFESIASVNLRKELEKYLVYGAWIKQSDPKYFNSREGYNESYLDTVPLIRNIVDYRPPSCSNYSYPHYTEKVSVIINYHNELLSLLLRCIYSILRNIPEENLHELILIDDGSNLTAYYHLRFVPMLVESFTIRVKFYRFSPSRGLIACRAFAAKVATGDVILVLDSHMEISSSFLFPLLNITNNNYRSIAAPVFDFWDSFTDNVDHYDGHGLGFGIYMNWKFVSVPKTNEPFRTAGLLGGAYLVTKRWMQEMEYFGEGMHGWGGENFDISVKTWRCYGEVYKVPCSRVLHTSARRSPISHGDRITIDSRQNNYILAKSYFNPTQLREFQTMHDYYPNISEVEEAVKHNKEVMKRLKCNRTFSWMQDNLMADLDTYDERFLIAKNLKSGEMCVRGDKTIPDRGNVLYLGKCMDHEATLFNVRLSKTFEVRYFDRSCIDHGYTPFKMVRCHRGQGYQRISYNLTTQELTDNYGHCLTKAVDSEYLIFDSCKNTTLKWTFETIFHPDLIR